MTEHRHLLAYYLRRIQMFAFFTFTHCDAIMSISWCGSCTICFLFTCRKGQLCWLGGSCCLKCWCKILIFAHRNSPSFRSFEEKVENTVSNIKVNSAWLRTTICILGGSFKVWILVSIQYLTIYVIDRWFRILNYKHMISLLWAKCIWLKL